MDGRIGCPLIGLGGQGSGCGIARGWELAHDGTVTMSPFWNCPTHWHHESGDWCLAWSLAFCVPTGTYWFLTGRAGFHLAAAGGFRKVPWTAAGLAMFFPFFWCLGCPKAQKHSPSRCMGRPESPHTFLPAAYWASEEPTHIGWEIGGFRSMTPPLFLSQKLPIFENFAIFEPNTTEHRGMNPL